MPANSGAEPAVPGASTVVRRGTSTDLTGGVMLVLLTVTVWGAQFPIAKSAFEHVDAFHTAVFRYSVAASVLIGVLVFSEGFGALRFNKQARAATVVGLIGMCGSPALVFSGLMLTRPEIAAIIIAVQPSVTAIAEWLVRGRQPGAFAWVCIALAFLGVITAVTHWNTAMLASSPTELIGAIMIFFGSLCWVFYTMAGERFAGWSVLRMTALTMMPGALGHIAVMLLLTSFGISQTPSLVQWWAVRWELIFLALPGVLLSMLCWNAGTKRIGPLNAMLFINLIPIITFGLQYWLGHRLSPYELAGAAIVIIALGAHNLALRRAHQSAAKNRRG